MPGQEHVAAVVVTHERRDLLIESLTALREQDRTPDDILVVDNASTDDTADVVRERFPAAQLVTLGSNVGGAGGFAAGLSGALESSADLIWVMDDDTIPQPGALAALLDARQHYEGSSVPALVASRVVWSDGRDHPMNTPREKPGVSRAERAAAAAAGCMAIRSASFVSLLLDATTVRERGLPIADYFLWNDDFEFTTRLLRGRSGLYCPASVVVHKTRTFGATDADPGERFFYEVRNKVWLFTRSPGLAAGERVLYAGSTARRWARTIVRSRDRATLFRAMRRGFVAGIRNRPRPSGAVIAETLLTRPRRHAGGETSKGTTVAHGNVESVPPAASPPSREGPAALRTPDVRSLEQFSLLMPVYHRDRPDFLRAAFRSAVDEQTRRPDQVVVVRDGPVPESVTECLETLIAESAVRVTVVELEDNGGLGVALDAGLAASDHDVVARMDSDDVSLPHRFETQLPLIEAGADIVGSGLLEFHSDPGETVGRRTPPSEPDDIVRYARFHDPFNHPTVVYRRGAVLAAGGYQAFPLMEDYWLFARMIANGARVVNVAEPLVCYRIGAGAYARRGGRALLSSELRLQRQFHEHGFTNRGQYVRNVVVRGGYRLVPEWLRRVAYRRVIATYGERRGRSRGENAGFSSAQPGRTSAASPVSRGSPNDGRSTESDALPER